jgi:4-amino-4-deoxy-L-arabinose transferase-like glycosyltransferase
MAALAWVFSKRRWSELARLEILSGVVLWIGLVMPWFVAMCVRHGAPFTDRLIFHDMFNRAFGHVHDTNVGDDTSLRFYVWQLGYAFFPWTGLVPLGLMAWLARSPRKGSGAESRQNDTAIVLFMWFLFAFALFTFMGTKFHHYIAAAVPPVAMLIGVAIDRMLRQDRQTSHERVMLAAVTIAGALLLVLVGRDLVLKPAGSEQPGAIRLLQLFTYNYSRAWPDTLDFSGALTWFTALGAVATAALASWRWRRQAALACGAVALACALWGLDVYMLETSRHWGQHETIAAYYEDRSSPDEMLVAYHMNWKGEDFYTSNRAPVFVSSGAPFTSWLKGQREKGTKVMYFITEHWSVGGLKSEVQAKAYREITDKASNNKFVVVRAEL